MFITRSGRCNPFSLFTAAFFILFLGIGVCVNIWRTAEACYREPDRYVLTVTAGQKGEAKFWKATNPESVVLVDGGQVRSVAYPYNTIVELRATPDPGCRFVGWYIDNDHHNASPSITLTLNQDHMAAAYFEVIPPPEYTLEANVQGEGSVTAAPNPPGGTSPARPQWTESYREYTSVNLSATPDLNWSFEHWTGDIDGSEEYALIPFASAYMNRPKSVTAHFKRVKSQLRVTVRGGGSVIPVPDAPGGTAPDTPTWTETYEVNTEVSLTPVPNMGWRFDHWEGDLAGSVSPAFVTMHDDKAIVAVFRQATLTVSAAGGKVTPSPNPPEGTAPKTPTWVETYPFDSVVDLTATASVCFRFDHWEGAATGTNPITSVTMDTDKYAAAVFIREKYQLDVHAEGGRVLPSPDPEGGSAPAVPHWTEYYPIGATVALTPQPFPGWYFVRWEGSVTGCAIPCSIVMTRDMNVYAVFARIQHPLFVTVVGGGTVTPDPNPEGGNASRTPIWYEYYDEGTSVSLTPVPAQGWRFDRWEGALSGSNTPGVLEMTEPRAVKAVFTRVTLTVTVRGKGTVNPTPNPEGGSASNTPTWVESYNIGETVSLNAIPDEGYCFVRWEDGLTGSANPDSVIMNVSRHVFAVFEPIKYRVTVNVLGSGYVSPFPNPEGGTASAVPIWEEDYEAGTYVNLWANAASGWRFDHWEEDATGSYPQYGFLVTGPKTFTAVFQRMPSSPCELKIDARPLIGGTTNPPPGTHECSMGSEVSVTATPAPGYRFVNWTGAKYSDEQTTGIVIKYPYQELNATFATEGTFVLTADSTEGGSVSPGYSTYSPGEIAHLTATPDPGYRFAGWSGTPLNGSKDPTPEFPMWSDYHVTAAFVEDDQRYHLTTLIKGEGEVRPASHSYAPMTRVTLSASPAEGWHFVSWLGEEVDGSGKNPESLTMNEDKVVAGVCAKTARGYLLRVETAGPGHVEGSPAEAYYPAGSVVQLRAIPDVGARFELWFGNWGITYPFVHYEVDTSVLMDGDKVVTACFADNNSDGSDPNDDLLEPKEDPCINKDLPKPATDPILPATGTAYLDVEDLRIKGRGIDFVWRRNYRSRGGINTPIGNDWDFSYNAKVARNSSVNDGESLIVADGGGRRETFAKQGVGLWAGRGSFTVVRRENNAIYTQEHPDGTVWQFNRLAGPAAGKLSTITDRNGNRLTFNYDEDGRLATVVDTLNRTIEVRYDDQDRIIALWVNGACRVGYQYYGENEGGGGDGDLKSATRYAVDSPSRTTTYTYSTGFGDDRLNHNLLTITDPMEQTYVTNVYSDATDSTDPTFDRVMRQIWGGGVTDFVYIPQTPSQSNHNASIKVIVNDRVGNVGEYFYDSKYRLVWHRAFMGRAPQPTQPTTETGNRPVNKLRPGDPDYREQLFRYNWDHLLIEGVLTVAGAQKRTEYAYKGDTDPNTSRTSAGNVVAKRTYASNGQLATEKTYAYDTSYGCSGCASFVTAETDETGNTTTYEYDTKGNRTKTIAPIAATSEDFEYNEYGQMTAHILPDNGGGHRRRDTFTYGNDGFLKSVTVDADGLNLTAQFTCDADGNVTSVTDPRGGVTYLQYNGFDELVEITSRALQYGTTYRKQFSYDKNGNVVQAGVEERGGILPPQGDGWLSTRYEYDSLNFLTAIVQEVSEEAATRTEFAYDDNRNLSLIRSPEAVAGRQPGSKTQIWYDELDRIWRIAEAPGKPEQVVTQFNYDDSDNLTQRIADVTRASQVYNYVYDELDRLVSATDPQGTVVAFGYTNADSPSSVHVSGLIRDGVQSHYGRMAEAVLNYDGLGRLLEERQLLFDPLTQEPISDGAAVTRYTYTGTSQLESVTDDNGNKTQLVYDTANRLAMVVDPLGNESEYVYDPNSNVTLVREVRKADSGAGGTDQTLQTYLTYDALDRLIEERVGLGSRVQYAYDSRSNLVEAKSVGAGLFDFQVCYTYDGLSRPTRVARLIGNDAAGDPVYTQSDTGYDDNSRVVWERDAKGGETRYEYDLLDRVTAIIHPDNSRETVAYDDGANTATFTDPDGTVTTDSYDPFGRLVHRALSAAAGVYADTTWQTFTYDGMSRLASAEDDDSLATFAYDSMSNVIGETQNGLALTRTFDGAGNPVRTVYPDGTAFERTFDALGRIRTLQRTGVENPLAKYAYLGPDRLLRREAANGTRLDVSYGQTGAMNPERFRHVRSADQGLLADLNMTWDGAGNKLQQRDLAPDGTDYFVNYDAAGRMTSFARNLLDQGVTQAVNYTYDGANNRVNADGYFAPGNYMTDALNRYTVIPGEDRSYSPSGALISQSATGGQYAAELAYDALGQLVHFEADRDVSAFADDFADGDYAGWTASGGTWTAEPGYVTNDGIADAVLVRAQDAEDFQLGLKFRRAAGVGTGDAIIDLRYQDDANRLQLRLGQDGAELLQYIDGSLTSLGIAPGAGTSPNVWYVLGVRCQGGSVEVWLGEDGQPQTHVLSVDDAAPLETGALAFEVAPDVSYAFDDVQLAQIVHTRAHYTYDALGRRIGKTLEGDTTESIQYVYDGWRLAEERSENGDPLADYSYGNALDEVVHMRRADADFYYHTDDLGTVFALTDANGAVVERYAYGPAGEPTVYDTANRALPQSLAGNPFAFTGRPWDPETGFYDYRYRLYDPRAARFLTRDPLGAWGDPTALGNPYAYCGNSPWDSVDPYGLRVVDPINDNNAWRNQLAGGSARVGDWAIRAHADEPSAHLIRKRVENGAAFYDGLAICVDWSDAYDPCDPSNQLANRIGKEVTISIVMGGLDPLARGVAGKVFKESVETLAEVRGAVAARLIEESGTAGRATAKALDDLPTLKISKSEHPELAENIEHAQMAGHPTELTRGPKESIRRNRRAALDGVPSIPGTTRDEYPFACTVEGGRGAWVGHVPSQPHSRQGRLIIDFFNNAGVNVGDRFRVEITP